MLSAQPISGIKDWWKGARMHLIMGLAQTHQVCLYHPKLQNISSEEILVIINAFPPISFYFCPLVAQKWSFYNGLFMANYICGFPFQVNMNCKHDLKILNNDYSAANFIINFSFSDNCFLDISSQNNNWISRGHSALSLSWSWFCLNDSFTKKVQVKVSSNVFNATLSGVSGMSCLSETSLATRSNGRKTEYES